MGISIFVNHRTCIIPYLYFEKTKHNKTLNCEDEKGYRTSSKLQGSWVFEFSDCGFAILVIMYSMNLSDQLRREMEND